MNVDPRILRRFVAVFSIVAAAIVLPNAAALPTQRSGTAAPLDRTGVYSLGSFTFTAPLQLTKTPVSPVFFQADAEPEVKTDLFGNLYVTAINGVPGGTDLWKSTDKGATFTYMGQPDGAQDHCTQLPQCAALGGGDDSIDVSTGGYLYVSSLWLGNTTMSVSTDGGTGGALPGQAWTVNPASGGVPVEDRQWVAAYGPQTVNMTFRQAPGTGRLMFTKSVDAGRTFSPPMLLTSADSTEGNLAVDPYNGNLYTTFIPTGATNRIDLLKSTDGGTTWSTKTGIYTGPAGTTPGQKFTILAVDRGGNVHLVFSRCTLTGGARSDCHVFLTSSSDAGETWLEAVRVDGAPGFSTGSSVMPWVSAGSPGVVDITFLNSPTSTPDVVAPWTVAFAQTRDAMSASPSFALNQAETTPMHNAKICFNGTGCVRADRKLLEYYAMTVDPDGNANIAYPNSVDNCNPASCESNAWFLRQTGGPNAYAPPAPPAPATFVPSMTIGAGHTGGEPNIYVDTDNCVYVSAIGSDLDLPIYKSTNGGNAFALKPETGPILVGDADLITIPDGNPSLNDDVYVSSLEIADVRILKSVDGESFAPAPGAAQASNPSSDRMWFAEDKFGADQVLYQNDHEFASEDIRVFKSVNDGAWSGTSAITDAELLARTTPNTTTGNIVVNKTNHNVFSFFPASTNTTNAQAPPFGKLLEVWAAVSTGNTTSTNAGTVWANYPILRSVLDSPDGTPAAAKTYGVNAGSIFAAGDVDAAGNVYVTWAMNNSRNNQWDIWFASSHDQGKTWYGPWKVNTDVGTHVLPWLAAGSDGRVTIAWYGTNAVGIPDTLPVTAQWNVFFAQSLNANSREPVFQQVQAGDHVMHVGSVRTGGLVGTGDRRLLDFFEIAVNRQGMTNIIYADTGTTTSGDAHLSYTRQSGGPSVYTNPTSPTCPGVPTAVTVTSLAATRTGAGPVRVTWHTASDLKTAGFNVWRSTTRGGRYAKLNRRLLLPKSVALAGASYSYVDRTAPRRASFYKLEVRTIDGKRRLIGPVAAAAPSRPHLGTPSAAGFALVARPTPIERATALSLLTT